MFLLFPWPPQVAALPQAAVPFFVALVVCVVTVTVGDAVRAVGDAAGGNGPAGVMDGAVGDGSLVGASVSTSFGYSWSRAVRVTFPWVPLSLLVSTRYRLHPGGVLFYPA